MKATIEAARTLATEYHELLSKLDSGGEARIEISESDEHISFIAASTDALEETHLDIRPATEETYEIIGHDYGKNGFIGRNGHDTGFITVEELRVIFDDFYQDWKSSCEQDQMELVRPQTGERSKN